MIDFLNWCDGKSLPLPTTVDENTKRAGVSQEYPDGYVRSQYPDGYFPPYVATAYLDLKNAGKKGKTVKGAGNTPL